MAADNNNNPQLLIHPSISLQGLNPVSTSQQAYWCGSSPTRNEIHCFFKVTPVVVITNVIMQDVGDLL